MSFIRAHCEEDQLLSIVAVDQDVKRDETGEMCEASTVQRLESLDNFQKIRFNSLTRTQLFEQLD